MHARIGGRCLQGLVAAGENPRKSPAIKKAVDFILANQRPNGGWGESYLSCVDKAWPEDGTGGQHHPPPHHTQACSWLLT